MSNKRALILGMGGQDAFFMSWLLVRQGYQITGVLLPSDMFAPTIPHLPAQGVRLVQGDICDEALMRRIIRDEKPEHIYNFAGISFIPYSWESPGQVAWINGSAVGNILNAIRQEYPESRFFQAGSSEMFGHSPLASPQNEDTPFRPDNPYGSSKVLAAHLLENYRSRFGLFACVGILYNHESEWRHPRFVTRKITSAAASIKTLKAGRLKLGNLEAVRDWSYAGDIVEAIWLMMTAHEAKDYVLASGIVHSVRDVLETAFGHLGLDWEEHVENDSSLNRPLEPISLCGDPSRAMNELGWKPKLRFQDFIKLMVDTDITRLNKREPSSCQPAGMPLWPDTDAGAGIGYARSTGTRY
jgi:GDPmannose 4,6-dehydratase